MGGQSNGVRLAGEDDLLGGAAFVMAALFFCKADDIDVKDFKFVARCLIVDTIDTTCMIEQ